MHQLQIAWCRISEIEDGAFIGLNLENLELDGNPLCPQEFWVRGVNRSMNATHLLVLKECTINADDAFPYDASFIFYNFPSLHALDLSSNYLFALPSFIHFSALNDTPSQLELNFLDLKSNSIKQLRHSESSAMCKAFPKLLYLDISRNYMKTIEKLCLSLTGLYAQNNDLYENATINFKSFSELSNLITLNLDDYTLTK